MALPVAGMSPEATRRISIESTKVAPGLVHGGRVVHCSALAAFGLEAVGADPHRREPGGKSDCDECTGADDSGEHHDLEPSCLQRRNAAEDRTHECAGKCDEPRGLGLIYRGNERS